VSLGAVHSSFLTHKLTHRSGHPVEMHSPFPPLLADIAAQLATPECLGADVHFNHAMLNRYEDGSVYIGKCVPGRRARLCCHADTCTPQAQRQW
jgi:hypothetical protein